MSELHIIRKKQLFAPLNCCFHIYIDDKKMTTLTNGDDDKLKIDKGNHNIQVRNNYFKTRNTPFYISADEVKVIETSSMPLLPWLYFFAPVVLIIVAFLKLLHVSLPSFVFPLALVPFITFIILALVLGLLKRGILLKGI